MYIIKVTFGPPKQALAADLDKLRSKYTVLKPKKTENIIGPLPKGKAFLEKSPEQKAIKITHGSGIKAIG